jgi:hypothetical protein
VSDSEFLQIDSEAALSALEYILLDIRAFSLPEYSLAYWLSYVEAMEDFSECLEILSLRDRWRLLPLSADQITHIKDFFEFLDDFYSSGGKSFKESSDYRWPAIMQKAAQLYREIEGDVPP